MQGLLLFGLDLNEENILRKIDEDSLFRFYFRPDYVVGKPYASPFRKDERPSFNVFKSTYGTNTLMYKDFGTGDCGNIFKFVGKLFNIPYAKTLIKINNDFKLDLAVGNIEERDFGKKEIPLREFSPYKAPEIDFNLSNKTTAKIRVRETCWSYQHLGYWEEYGIGKETLLLYKVAPIDALELNGKLIIRPNDKNLIFSYKFFNRFSQEEQYKIYQPKNPEKKYKWLSNTKSGVLQGVDQIDMTSPNDLIIITKSLKDVMTLNSLGYKAVAPVSEVNHLHKDVLGMLNANKLVVFFDNDSAGLTGADSLKNQYGLDNFIIPKESDCKDISDFYKKFGEEQSKEFLINSLSKLI